MSNTVTDLNFRQKILYQHRCDIWQVTNSVNAATGKPNDTAYSLYASGVPCLYEWTQNLSQPHTGAGRVKRQDEFTNDIVHMVASQVLHDGWFLVNRTILPGGKRSINYGEVHRVQGSPETFENAGVRSANKQSVRCQTVEKPPFNPG